MFKFELCVLLPQTLIIVNGIFRVIGGNNNLSKDLGASVCC